MITAIYARVSTEEQSLASQIPDLERWEKAHPEDRCKWFHDKFSGKTFHRPGWEQIEKQLAQGKVKQIVVWRSDRLGRNAGGMIRLYERLQKMGVGLVSLREGFDLGTPAGRMMATMLAGIAQYERESIHERIMAGLAARRAAGGNLGGRQVGWRICDLNALAQYHKSGLTKMEIAKVMGISFRTVRRRLRESLELWEMNNKGIRKQRGPVDENADFSEEQQGA